MRLPSGQNKVGVSDYIPKLMKLLVDNEVASDRDIIEVYEDGDVGKIKELIVENKRPTLTLTCTKYLTGTDIPQWGSVIFLSPIGNSIKLFEQIIGRVKRPYDGKKNCGVFIGSIDEVINLHVSVEQLVSMMRGKDESFKDVLIRVLKNYNVFTGENDSWKELDFPDLVSRLEALNIKGNYGVRGCIKELKVPDDFNLVFKSNSSASEDVVIVDNGMTDAKDLKRKILSKQLQLFEKEFKKEKNKITFYRNMVRTHLSKVRVLCYLENLNTLQEGVEFIVKSINENNSVVLDGIGKGVELIPYYMLDKNQIDIPYFNQWVHKINSDNLSLDGLLELLASKELEDEDNSFYPTPILLFRTMIEKLLENEIIENPVVLDPVAGRGTSLITLLKMYKEKGYEVNTSNIYYNDIDSYMTKIFKKINREYNLGIPEENIFNEDVLNPSQKFKEILMKEFDVVLGNWPYEKKVGPKKTKAIWNEFTELFLTKVKTKYLLAIHPSGWRNIGGNYKNIQKLIFNRQLIYLEIHNEKDGLSTFGKETRYDWFLIKNAKNLNNLTEIKFQEGNTSFVNIKELEFIPNSNYEKIKSLLAKNGEETVNIIHNNIHHTQRKYMKESTDSINKYPCVYTVRSGDEPTFWYSPFNNKGHFGESKLIFSNGRISSIGSFIDTNGEYGLCQFSSGIVDDKKLLSLIKSAFDSIEFRNLMESCSVSDMSVNYKILSLFRKDFWKEFV